MAVRLQPGSISGECGPDGRFELVGPWGAGSYSLVVLARGHGRASASFGAGASDLGDIVLPPAGAIDGHVTGPQGSPLAGAQVILWSKAGLGETRRTDDLGRFRYPDLEPGWYSIFVQASGLPPLNSNVELPSGGARAVVELTFQGTRPLSVFVRAEDGGTVAGATVYVSAGYRMSKGVTGENGRVDLDLAAAPRTVIVEPPVLAGELRYRHDPVFTLRGDEREFTVVLTMEALARGVVRAPDGKPLARAEVKARHNGLWIASTATNDDGTFVIQVPRDSVFDLVLTGHSFESNPAVLRERHTLFRGELPRVRAGASGLEIRATGVEAKRSLRVRVLSPDGSPVEAATVSALPSAYPLCVQTDAHGYAEFTALAAEDVSIRVAATDQPWLPPETVAVVPEGQDLSLRFRIPVTITGTVFLPDGRPASQASVNGLKNDADVGRSCTADTEGRFRLLLEPSVEAPLRIHVLADSGAGPVLEGYADGISPGDTDVRVTLSPMK